MVALYYWIWLCYMCVVYLMNYIRNSGAQPSCWSTMNTYNPPPNFIESLGSDPRYQTPSHPTTETWFWKLPIKWDILGETSSMSQVFPAEIFSIRPISWALLCLAEGIEPGSVSLGKGAERYNNSKIQQSYYWSLNNTICHWNCVQRQPFFVLDVGLVLNQVFITYREIHHVGTIQDLLYISMTITYVFYLHLIISKSYLLSCTKQKQNKAHRASMVNLGSTSKGEPPSCTSHASWAYNLNMGTHTNIDIYVRTYYDQTTCYLRNFTF